ARPGDEGTRPGGRVPPRRGAVPVPGRGTRRVRESAAHTAPRPLRTVSDCAAVPIGPLLSLITLLVSPSPVGPKATFVAKPLQPASCTRVRGTERSTFAKNVVFGSARTARPLAVSTNLTKAAVGGSVSPATSGKGLRSHDRAQPGRASSHCRPSREAM